MCGGGAGIHVVITAREHFFVFPESPSISTSILFSIFLRCYYLYVFERACVHVCACRSQVHFTPRAPLPREPFQFYVFY